MKLPASVHVAIVDGENFMLMRNQGTALEPRLEVEAEPQIDEINKSAGVREHESAHRRGGEPHDRAAHAAGVADWLNRKALANEIEQLLIVADPSTLGEMRRHYDKSVEAVLIGELDKQLTNLNGQEIAKIIEAA